MKKSLSKLLVLSVAGLVLWGCASFPEKTQPTDSLVIIKTEFVNPQNIARGYEVVFNFSDGCKSTWVGEYSWDYCAVVVHEPGVELESLGARVQAGFRGEFPNYPVHVALPYEEGGIVIADFAFVHTITRTSEHGQTSGFNFRLLTEQEKEKLMAAITADGDFSSWLR